MKRFKKFAMGGDVDTSGLDPITAGGQQAIARGTQQIQEKLKALQQLGSSAFAAPKGHNVPPDDPSRFMNGTGADPSRNDATLANQGQYEQQLSQRLQQNAASEAAQQAKQNALDEPIDESGYKTYSKGGEVKSRFSKLHECMGTKPEAEASEDPMEFMKKNKNMSIKNRKGVAF